MLLKHLPGFPGAPRSPGTPESPLDPANPFGPGRPTEPLTPGKPHEPFCPYCMIAKHNTNCERILMNTFLPVGPLGPLKSIYEHGSHAIPGCPLVGCAYHTCMPYELLDNLTSSTYCNVAYKSY